MPQYYYESSWTPWISLKKSWESPGICRPHFENCYYRLSLFQWLSRFYPSLCLSPDLRPPEPCNNDSCLGFHQRPSPLLELWILSQPAFPRTVGSFSYSVLLLHQQSLSLSSTYKHALAFLPILTNPSFDPTDTSSYCLISMLPFVNKIVQELSI